MTVLATMIYDCESWTLINPRTSHRNMDEEMLWVSSKDTQKRAIEKGFYKINIRVSQTRAMNWKWEGNKGRMNDDSWTNKI